MNQQCEKCDKQESNMENWSGFLLCENCSDSVNDFIVFNK